MKGVYKNLGQEVEFEFVETITATRRAAVVMGVTQMVVNSSYYLPFLKDMATKYHIIKAYAPTAETPRLVDKDGDLDMDALEIFLLESDLYEVLIENIDIDQYYEIMESIDDNIAYITGIDKTNIGNEVIALLRQLKDSIVKAESFFSDETMRNELTSLAQKFNRLDVTGDKIINLFTDDGK